MASDRTRACNDLLQNIMAAQPEADVNKPLPTCMMVWHSSSTGSKNGSTFLLLAYSNTAATYSITTQA